MPHPPRSASAERGFYHPLVRAVSHVPTDRGEIAATKLEVRTMRSHAMLLTAVASVFIQSAGLCSDDPTAGPEHFPQFRNLSALAGSGFGADSKGYSTLSGPTALSTPVAPVLSHTQFR